MRQVAKSQLDPKLQNVSGANKQLDAKKMSQDAKILSLCPREWGNANNHSQSKVFIICDYLYKVYK